MLPLFSFSSETIRNNLPFCANTSPGTGFPQILVANPLNCPFCILFRLPQVSPHLHKRNISRFPPNTAAGAAVCVPAILGAGGNTDSARQLKELKMAKSVMLYNYHP